MKEWDMIVGDAQFGHTSDTPVAFNFAVVGNLCWHIGKVGMVMFRPSTRTDYVVAHLVSRRMTDEC